MKTPSILLLAALCAAGCNDGVVQEPRPSGDLLRYQQFTINGSLVYCATIKGHDYVIVRDSAIVHAAHCPCFTNNLESYRIDIKPGIYTNIIPIKSSVD